MSSTAEVIAERAPIHRTAHDLALCELKPRRELERALLGATDGLWDWRPECDQLWCSPRLLELLGFSPDDAFTLNTRAALEDRIHPLDAEHFAISLARVAETGSMLDLQARLRHQAGDYRWFRLRGQRNYDEHAAAYVSGGVTDITDHKQSFERLQEMEDELLQKQRAAALDCLAGGIAHEFNNLLQAIRGYMSFALDELTPGTQTYDDVQQAIATTDRAADLSRQLLGYSRQNCASGEKEVHDLGVVLQQLHGLLRPTIGEQIDLRIECAPQRFELRGDVAGLSEALLNLCLNARDAMPTGGVLILRAESFTVEPEHALLLSELAPGPYVRLFVTDTGVGMDPTLARRIFEPFFSTKGVGEGTGLGLSIVRRLIERLRGRIDVTSQIGGGTCFALYLPLGKNRISNEAELFLEPRPSGSGEKEICMLNQVVVGCVLYIEDEPVVQDVCRRMLESAGHRVVCVDDGEAALRTFREGSQQFDVVLSDVVLPRGSGREIAAAVHAIDHNLPVILCTGYDPYAPQGQDLAAQGVEVLAKPFNKRQLLGAVDAALRSRLAVH
jgi:signal transduction histidine kinase/CheY-like chemotaxis protein